MSGPASQFVDQERPASGRACGDGPVPETHRQAVEEFLTFLRQAKGLAANTLAAYRHDLYQFTHYMAQSGTGGWEALDSAATVNFLLWLKQQEYAPASQARKLAAVRSFTAYLTRRGLLPTDPAAAITSPRVARQAPRPIGAQELEHLLAASSQRNTPESARNSAMFALLCATGMRVSELSALDLEDVDLARQEVRCVGRGGRERRLRFDERATLALREYLTWGRARLDHGAGGQALFLNHRGQRVSRQGFWLVLKRCAAEAGLAGRITPHLLRHTVAAQLLEQGCTLHEVQALLGHANRSTTQMYLR